eukprot:m.95626 g.95626  ORF g.95626 m.95626 type:complete len:80 (-) comp16608_c0_seq3:1694-1933(-)
MCHMHMLSANHETLQWNMGEGNTLIILSMLCSSLGDRDDLSRMIVPHALQRSAADNMAVSLAGFSDAKSSSTDFWHCST